MTLRARLSRIRRRHPFLLAAFLLACALTLVLALRLAFIAPHLPSDLRNQPIEGWMTPRFIVHAYDLPRETVAELLQLPPGTDPRKSLQDIAREQGRSLPDLLAILNAAAAAQRARPTP